MPTAYHGGVNFWGQSLRRRKVVGGSVLLAASAALLGGSWQPLTLVSDPDGCVSVDPLQSWVGLQLHLMAAGGQCQYGELTQGAAYQPIITISLAISISGILAGLGILLAALGGGLIARRGLRMVRRWWQRRVAPAWSAWSDLLLIDRRVPVRLEVRSTHPASRHRVASRRAPPASCC